ncbi:diadenylate cyclase CdaA [Borrelia miyamotoi]|uniref:Diadenylate cyclase n=1 Tax=Borrelia miyamotoi TaxID=47466 RepID=A0AAQ2WXN2_9SPIR|nr:diadenylate cyclase CdaA [Borrelia miyamotoi]AGT27013.1 membrane protein [Borrelia miyamotoi LB-2001]AJA58226.1 membrane protein [Borrelia miyamotoi]AOW95302.1 TIGR00159 family protein [Borrelia miyamotoi]QTL83180.1 TIGR00159 family protein [Borrelia miyamotoi]WAZ85533.1 diadenylate cyclase CdaA [Borrelia miyamotoi]
MISIDSINQIKDVFSRVLDISITSTLVYYIYKNVINSYSVNLLKGMIIITSIGILSYYFNLYTINWLLNYMASILPIAMLILFHQEIKKIIMQIGNFNLSFKLANSKEETTKTITELIKAIKHLSENKSGSLICIEKKIQLNQIINKGIKLDSIISNEIIISIFDYETPLHDGAIIISNNKIAYAGSFLPLSNVESISKTFGTRHRAGLGISENSDAITIITSEETGSISLTQNGKLEYNLDLNEIRKKLNLALIE